MRAVDLVRKAGLPQAMGRTGAVTLIQRFGSALNLNIHFHLLVLDGACELGGDAPRFCGVSPPTSAELAALLGKIVTRIARHLERLVAEVGAAAERVPEIDVHETVTTPAFDVRLLRPRAPGCQRIRRGALKGFRLARGLRASP